MRRPPSPSTGAGLCLGAAFASALLIASCRDVSEFDTRSGDHFGGALVAGSFVRSGVADGTRMCLTLDTTRLQDGPGALTTSDGRFRGAPLRPIPQLWHDPISTLSFGDGRRQNLVYAVLPVEDGGAGVDVMAIVSLMQSGAIEVRLLRGAPREGAEDAAAPASGPAPVFAVFTLDRQRGGCTL
jgi:hypothetical protein